MLGAPRFLDEPKRTELLWGINWARVHGFRGDILYIESRKLAAKGGRLKLQLTGSLGKVMQESAQTALSFLLSNQKLLGLTDIDLEDSEIHLHLPDGATPKDGPSAGVAILMAFVSL